MKFIRCTVLRISTFRPLDFSLCYQLGVLICQWFEIILQFSHSVSLALKDLVFLVPANSVENRLALWRVLALALA
jgi:hypothetical protein